MTETAGVLNAYVAAIDLGFLHWQHILNETSSFALSIDGHERMDIPEISSLRCP
jgi:hypothetical protein